MGRLHTIGLFTILGFLQPIAAAECRADDSALFARITERWRWEKFWQVGIFEARYREGERVVVGLLSTMNAVAYCSATLGICGLYDLADSRLDRLSITKSVPSGTAANAVRNFVQKERPDVLNPEAPISCESALTLPSLPPPDSVQKRTVPGDFTKLRAWLTERQSDLFSVTRKRMEIVVPFYAETDPSVFMLSKAEGEPDQIVWVVHTREGRDWKFGNEAGWKFGGHYGQDANPSNVAKFRRIILSAEMATIRTP